MKDLRSLDDRFVRAAARRVGRAAERLAVRRDAVTDAVRGVSVRDLRALDDRYASSGPLAFLRDVPQVGLVVIAVLFLVGALSAVDQQSSKERAQQQTTAVDEDNGAVQVPERDALGPDVGDQVSAYLTSASDGLAKAARESGGARRTALVSFSAYRTPEQAEVMLAGYVVQRVFLRAQAGGKEAAQLPVDISRDLLPELRVVYERTARARAQAQKAYQNYVDTLEVNNKEDQAFKDLYAAFAKSTGLEAAAYRGNCACVYAAVVSATPSQLVALRARAGVRAVELGPADRELKDLQVLPLLPEVTGVVPRQQAPEDPP